jgi:hypothetical protein
MGAASAVTNDVSKTGKKDAREAISRMCKYNWSILAGICGKVVKQMNLPVIFTVPFPPSNANQQQSLISRTDVKHARTNGCIKGRECSSLQLSANIKAVVSGKAIQVSIIYSSPELITYLLEYSPVYISDLPHSPLKAESTTFHLGA